MKFSSDPHVFETPPPPVAFEPAPWSPAELGAHVGSQPATLAPVPEVDISLRLESEMERAWNEGYLTGVAEARQDAEERIRTAMAALDQATRDLCEAESMRIASLTNDLAALSTAIAQHIIGREVKDGQVVAELVRRAVTEFPPEQAIRVRINPHDLSTIATTGTPDGGAIPIAPGRELAWVPDPALTRGSVVVEGRERIVDGRVDLALERIYRQLSDA